jgi:DNA primase large subunit
MLDPWYVTGFCDGEAAFTYSRSGGTFGLIFSIKQRADSRKIIEDLRQFFGYLGNIYEVKESKEGQKSGHTKPSVIYKITRIDELKLVVDHFDKYLLQNQKKFEAYSVWREMVMYKLENYRDIEYDKLRVLAEKLSSLNSKSRAFVIHKK